MLSCAWQTRGKQKIMMMFLLLIFAIFSYYYMNGFRLRSCSRIRPEKVSTRTLLLQGRTKIRHNFLKDGVFLLFIWRWRKYLAKSLFSFLFVFFSITYLYFTSWFLYYSYQNKEKIKKRTFLSSTDSMFLDGSCRVSVLLLRATILSSRLTEKK